MGWDVVTFFARRAIIASDRPNTEVRSLQSALAQLQSLGGRDMPTPTPSSDADPQSPAPLLGRGSCGALHRRSCSL